MAGESPVVGKIQAISHCGQWQSGGWVTMEKGNSMVLLCTQRAVGILQQESLEAEKETSYSFRILTGQCNASSLSPLFYE